MVAQRHGTLHRHDALPDRLFSIAQVAIAIERVALRALTRPRFGAVLDATKSAIASVERGGAVDHVCLQVFVLLEADLPAADLFGVDAQAGVYRAEVASTILTGCDRCFMAAVEESSDLALPRHRSALPSQSENEYGTPLVRVLWLVIADIGDSLADRIRNQVGAILRFQLGHDVCLMRLHRSDADHQPVRDLLVRISRGHEL